MEQSNKLHGKPDEIKTGFNEQSSEMPIGRPAVFYIPEKVLNENPELHQEILSDVGAKFGGSTEKDAGETSYHNSLMPMKMFITSFGGENKEEVIERISWLKEYLESLMEKTGMSEIYMETGEDSQLLFKNQDAKIEESDLGRPAIFYISDNQLERNPQLSEEIKRFLAEHYQFAQIKESDSKYQDASDDVYQDETFFKTAFLDKNRIPELTQFLSGISEKLGNSEIYLETGEDAKLIKLEQGEIKTESLGRPAIFYVPQSKLDSDILQQITDFLKTNFGNCRYKEDGGIGRWQNDDGVEYADNNAMFKTSFIDNTADKQKIKELKKFLAELAQKINEEAIYLETGEDAQLIYSNSRI